MSNFLSKQLREKIIEYVDVELINKEDTFEIWRANNEEDLIDAMCRVLKVDDNDKNKLWMEIIDEYWITVDDIFGKFAIMFLKTIVKYNAVVTREELIKNLKVFGNAYGLRTAVEELVDRELINQIKLSNSKVLYVVAPKILLKVRAGGKE